MPVELTFLGTGTSQGVPVISCPCAVCQSADPRDNRLRSSVLIRSEHISLVIDTGPDFRYQMLREKVKSLDAVLITHEHRDHIAGLDDVRAFNFVQQRPMDVYAEDRVREMIKTQFLYAFENNYPGVPRLNLHRIKEEDFKIGSLDIRPIRLMHYNLPILGFRIGDLAYLTDASYISSGEKEKLKGLRVLVVNALRKKKHPTHFCLDDALELISEIKPEKAFLTHISHQMGKAAEVQKELPREVQLAWDGLKIAL